MIFLSFCLTVFLSFRLSVFLFFCLCVYVFFQVFVIQWLCLSVSRSLCCSVLLSLSVRLSFCLSFSLFVCLSLFLSVFKFIIFYGLLFCLAICTFNKLVLKCRWWSVSLSVCLSVCLSLHIRKSSFKCSYAPMLQKLVQLAKVWNKNKIKSNYYWTLLNRYCKFYFI